MCEFCQDGHFNPQPNYERNCHRCTSCSQRSENLEVDTPCTIARDTRCRCKQHHFCHSFNEGICILCHPCIQCGPEGIKHQCTGSNNTVCNDKTEVSGGGDATTIVVAVLLTLAALTAVLVWFVLRRRKQQRSMMGNPASFQPVPAPAPHEVEVEILPNVDLRSYVSDIVDVLGWSDMKEIATRSDFPQTTIENCYEDHKDQARERTYDLLLQWMEFEGREASQKLIQVLKRMNRRGKVEKIQALLYQS